MCFCRCSSHVFSLMCVSNQWVCRDFPYLPRFLRRPCCMLFCKTLANKIKFLEQICYLLSIYASTFSGIKPFRKPPFPNPFLPPVLSLIRTNITDRSSIRAYLLRFNILHTWPSLPRGTAKQTKKRKWFSGDFLDADLTKQ